jgi:hypothetical protein
VFSDKPFSRRRLDKKESTNGSFFRSEDMRLV